MRRPRGARPAEAGHAPFCAPALRARRARFAFAPRPRPRTEPDRRLPRPAWACATAQGMAGSKLRTVEWAVSEEDAEPMDDGPSESADLTPKGWAQDEYTDALPSWPDQRAGIAARASAENPLL